VPEYVKAGEPVEVVGTLDQAPNFSGSSILYYITGPEGFTVQSSVELQPGQLRFSFKYVIPYAAKAGTWIIEKLVFYDGVKLQIPLKIKQQDFTVIDNKGLVYPQSAQISLKPSQVQLLRGEALRLQTRLQDLKSKIRETSDKELRGLLEKSISEALAEIDATSVQYQNLNDDSQKEQATVFFSDIRTSYMEALGAVRAPTRASYKPATYNLDSQIISSGGYPESAQGTLRAYEHNVLAYETVTGQDSLSFDLVVQSTPPGAVISYGLRGDSSLRTAEDQTNATIKSLTYAIWLVRVSAPGFVTQQKEHNAINENYHVIHFDLIPEPKTK
jgi:hypothetical protein